MSDGSKRELPAHAFPRKQADTGTPVAWMQKAAQPAQKLLFRGQKIDETEALVPSFAAPGPSANDSGKPPTATSRDPQGQGVVDEFRRLLAEAASDSGPAPSSLRPEPRMSQLEPSIPSPPRPPSKFPPRPPSGGYAPVNPNHFRPPSGGYSRPPTGGFPRPSLVPQELAQIDSETLKLRAEFSEAVLSMALIEKRALEDSEEAMLKLAVEIARSLIETELTAKPELHRAMVSAAVAAVGEGGVVRVRASRTAYEAMVDHFGSPRLDVDGSRVELTLDTGLDGLGVVVDRGDSHVDGRVDARLDQIRKALLEARRNTRRAEAAA